MDHKQPQDSDKDTDLRLPEPGEGPISFDAYRSSRRPKKPTWPYVVSMVFMLATLVLLVLFKDGCGSQVSEMIFHR